MRSVWYKYTIKYIYYNIYISRAVHHNTFHMWKMLVVAPTMVYMRPIRCAVPVVTTSAACRMSGSSCRRKRCATWAMSTRLSNIRSRMRPLTADTETTASAASASATSNWCTCSNCSFICLNVNRINSNTPPGRPFNRSAAAIDDALFAISSASGSREFCFGLMPVVTCAADIKFKLLRSKTR